MTTPLATVRLQLHANFNLHDARAQLDYFEALGISHLYLSPITRARPGSTHGYDVIDHTMVNPELGGEPAFLELAQAARARGLGIILDIVPNHMATHRENEWWWDVLRLGRASRYAAWFDIDWRSADPYLRGKVLAPFLARPYGASLRAGDIRLVACETDGSFYIEACGTPYPLAPDTLKVTGLDARSADHLYDPGTADGRQRLHALLERQHYRLTWWRCAPDQINWRRFFEINELIGVCVEHKEVFDAVHALPLRLYADGWIDGLRVDHVDGLSEPQAYCRRLRRAMEQRLAQRPADVRSTEPWLVVEKILAPGERLSADWAVDGTTGYDFMDEVGAVLHDEQGEAPLTAVWQEISGDARSCAEVLYEARELMLSRHFAAERQSLIRCVSALAQSEIDARDWTPAALGRALDALLAEFPVYRTYAGLHGRDETDTRRMRDTWARVCARVGGDYALPAPLVNWLDRRLGGEPLITDHHAASAGAGHEASALTLAHVQAATLRRFQQLTPPLAAKSLEDTTFYRYGRMLSRNEVGSDPAVFALDGQGFHRCGVWRAEHGRRSMLATATHDHKRGEDVRARLAVLSERPTQWASLAQQWLATLGVAPGDPRAADAYMLLQTIVGTWPVGGWSADMPAQRDRYVDRIIAWQTKALREAKRRSGWAMPDEAAESEARSWVQGLKTGGPYAAMLSPLQEFVDAIAPVGAVNSLTQAVLHYTVPGVPDLYQGRERWDFSLVDPDNREPVDFDERRAGLLKGPPDWDALLQTWQSGEIKQGLIQSLLHLRRHYSDVFSQGDYQGLTVVGPRARHVLAFMRQYEDQMAVVIVPRLCAEAIPGPQPRITQDFWSDTAVRLPGAAGAWRAALNPDRSPVQGSDRMAVKDALGGLPVAIWMSAA